MPNFVLFSFSSIFYTVTGSIPFSCFSEESNFPQNCVIFYHTEMSKIYGSNVSSSVQYQIIFFFFLTEILFSENYELSGNYWIESEKSEIYIEFYKNSYQLNFLVPFCIFYLFYFVLFLLIFVRHGEKTGKEKSGWWYYERSFLYDVDEFL